MRRTLILILLTISVPGLGQIVSSVWKSTKTVGSGANCIDDTVLPRRNTFTTNAPNNYQDFHDALLNW